MISRLKLSLWLLFKGGEENMAVVYATLIIKGLKTYTQVPKQIKDQVAEVLVGLEADHLIKE